MILVILAKKIRIFFFVGVEMCMSEFNIISEVQKNSACAATQ
jgi:hypothetical protein